MNRFAGRLQHLAATRPHGQAFVFLDARGREASAFDWAGFAAATRRTAAALQREGLAGRRVALLCPTGPEFVVALWGALAAGAIPVPAPVDTFERSVGRAHAILAVARPAAAVLAPAAAALAPRILDATPALPYEALAAGADAPWPDAPDGDDVPTLLQFTSGSTATPRGVLLGAGNIAANCAAIIAAYGFTPADSGVSWLPMHHDMGLIGHILVPVFVGSRSVLMPPLGFLQRPERWLQAIDRWRATTSTAPNFAFEYCLRRARDQSLEGLDLSCWRVAICGAEPVDAATLDAFVARYAPFGFARSALRPSYGLAETTLIATAGDAAGPLTLDVDGAALGEGIVRPAATPHGTRRLVGCGVAVAGMELAIADPETGGRCPPGRSGEILLRGSSVAQGYVDGASATLQPLPTRMLDADPAPWFRSGDLGFLHDGALFVAGRGDDLLQLRGRNVHASEVEMIAGRAHAALEPSRCAAVGVPHEGTAGLVVLAEVARLQDPPDSVVQAIRAALAAGLDVVPLDVRLVFLGTLPRTTSGKLRRNQCRAAYIAGTLRTLDEQPRRDRELSSGLPLRSGSLEAVADATGDASLKARGPGGAEPVSDPNVDLDFLGPGMIECPHAGYDAVRARGTLVWSPLLRAWLAVGYEAARAVLGSSAAAVPEAPARLAETARKAHREIPAMLRIARHIPFFANDADHARLRRGLGASLGAVRGRFAPASAAAAQHLLAPLRAAGGGDLAHDVALRLHVEVTCELLGTPPADRAHLSTLAALGRTLDDAVPLREYQAADSCIAELTAYMRALLVAQRRTPSGTLLEELDRRLEPDPNDAPDESIATAAAALLALGRDTVAGTLTLGLASLLDAGGGRIDPATLRPGAALAEDFLRFGSSAQYVKRRLTADAVIDGTAVRAGDHVIVLIAGANRDPVRFPAPDEIRADRGGWSIAFGHGAHSCLGGPMAREEIAAALEALAKLPALSSRPGRRFARSRATRGYATMPVSFA